MVEIPIEAVNAREAMQPDEEQRIVESMREVYWTLQGRLHKQQVDKAVASSQLELQRPINQVMVGILEAQSTKSRFIDSAPYPPLSPNPNDSAWTEYHRKISETLDNPALRDEVVKLAGRATCPLFLEEFEALLTRAVDQARQEQDEGFFINLGAAFSRARKLRKRPPTIHLKGSISQELAAPHIELMIECWITQDGVGPQLCMFTDEAVTAFLNWVLDDEDESLELEAVRQARKRYGLIQARKRVVRGIMPGEIARTKMRRATLWIQ